MKNDLCYIILVHFNSLVDTRNCLNSINDSSSKNYKIILVDNNSSDDSCNILRREFTNNKKIIFINSKYNGGYGYGLNLGIKYSLSKKECKYLWMINNDVLITKYALEELLNSDKSANKNYVWGSKVLNIDNSIQSLGCSLNEYFMSTVHNYKNCDNYN